MQWIVFVEPDKGPQRAFGAFDASADDQAHVPFDEATAKSLAANINSQATDAFAVALPLEESVQPGV